MATTRTLADLLAENNMAGDHVYDATSGNRRDDSDGTPDDPAKYLLLHVGQHAGETVVVANNTYTGCLCVNRAGDLNCLHEDAITDLSQLDGWLAENW